MKKSFKKQILNEEENVLLNLTATALFQKGKPLKINNDSLLILEASKKQTIVSIIASVLLPQIKGETRNSWLSAVAFEIAKNRKIELGNFLIHKLMTENNIPYVIIKGISSAYYYPNPLLRAQGDIDFLVKPQDIIRVEKILINYGFQFSKRGNHEVAYKRNGIIYEIHFSISGIPEGQIGEVIKNYFEDIFDKSELVQINGNNIYIPNLFHHGLIILLHIARHMITEGVGIRHICDWAVLVNSMDGRFSEIFEKSLKEIGLWKFAQALTQVSIKYLKLSTPCLIEPFDESYIMQFTIMLIRTGNFGHLDDNNLDRILIANGKYGGISQYPIIVQYFRSLCAITKENFPIIKKLPIFMPVGVLYSIFRYLYRILTGKRKCINFYRAVIGARKRKNKFKQLKLFKSEYEMV